MKRILLSAIFATALLCQQVSAQDAKNSTDELKALILKVRTDIQSGKRTEAELSGDLNQFDALLAEHKGEKTDEVAAILYMKAQLYSEVIGDDAKAGALIKQLTNDYSGTAFVTRLREQETQEAKIKAIEGSLRVGSQFPDFNEKDAMGKPLSIANYKGKVVMIDFWATWCGPCRGELPNVVATYQKYHDKGFEIIGVSLDSDRDKLDAFLKETDGMTWPQFFDGQGWSNKLAVKYGVESIPFAVLIGPDGKIIGKDLRGDDLENAVAAAVGK